MKLSLITPNAFSHHARTDNGTAPAAQRPRPRRQGGMAVIVMLALLSIILLFIAANMHSLYSLKREVQLTERRQTQRLAALSAANSAAASLPAAAARDNPINGPAPPQSAPE